MDCKEEVSAMIISLDMSSETPIYVQLRNQIVTGIGRGELRAGAGGCGRWCDRWCGCDARRGFDRRFSGGARRGIPE